MAKSNPKVKWGVSEFAAFTKSVGCDNNTHAAIDKELRAKGLEYAQKDKASSTRVAASTIEQWCISLWDQYGSAFKRQKDDTREKAIEYFLQGVRRFKSDQKNAPRQCQTPAPTDSVSQVGVDNRALRRIRYKDGDPQPPLGDYSVQIYDGDTAKKFLLANAFPNSATDGRARSLSWDLFVAAVKKKFPEFDAAAYSLFPVPYEGGEGSENVAVDDIDALQAESQDQYNARLASIAFRMVSRNDDTISDSPSKPTDSLEPTDPRKPTKSPEKHNSPRPSPKKPPRKRRKRRHSPSPSVVMTDNSPERNTIETPVVEDLGEHSMPASGVVDLNDGDSDEEESAGLEPTADIDEEDEDEEDEDEEDEDNRLSDEDFDAQMEKLQSLQAVAQINRELFSEFRRFFRLKSPTTDPEDDIHIPGMSKPVRIYQAYCAWWMLRHEKQYRIGGFLGDEMGLGKTVTSLLVTVLNRMLYLMHREVKQSRDNEDGKHLPADAEAGAKCPSRKNFRIQCVCEPGSVSCSLNVTSGANLFLVPLLVLGTYKEEMEKWLDMKNEEYRWEWFISHGDHRKLAIPDHPYVKSTFGTIGRVEDDEEPTLPANKLPRNPEAPGAIAALQRTADGHTRPDHNRFLIVTTPNSYDSWVKKRLRIVVCKAYKFTYTPASFKSTRNTRPYEVKEDAKSGHSFGRIWVDEFHTAYKADTLFTKIIRAVLSESPWNIPVWAMSGTPYEESPLEMAGYVWAMEQDWWEECPTLRRFTHTTMTTYKPDFDRILGLMKDDRPMTSDDEARWAEIVSYLSEFCSLFMIRRETETTWFGKPMVVLPPLEQLSRYCDFDEQHNSLLDKLTVEFNTTVDVANAEYEKQRMAWEEGGRIGKAPVPTTDNTFKSTQRLLLLAVSYPYLAHMAAELGLHHTVKEIHEGNYWTDRTNSNPYVKHLDEITGSSCKLKELGEIVEGLDDDERLVIISSHPVVSLIVALWLEIKCGYGRDQIGLIHSKIPITGRRLIVDGFQDTVDVNTGERKNKKHVRFLVGTIRTMGYSITCTKAKRLTLMEPAYLARDEEQAIKRVHRISQTEACTIYKLSTAKLGVETRIIRAHKVKNTVRSGFYLTRLVNRSAEEENKELREAIKKATEKVPKKPTTKVLKKPTAV